MFRSLARWFSGTLICSVAVFLPTATLLANETGTLVYQSVFSPALKDNLLGDSSYRSVIVYLPPGYAINTENRYPVVYLLHGYNDTNTIWRDGAFQGFSVPESVDRLIAQGLIKEMILVMPDGRNAYGGSYYTNSVVTGLWEDFITKDLVEFIDRTYRSLPQSESRGIAGHSMGGYGAIYLAMRHPDVYTAVYGLSACCLSMVGDVRQDNPEWVKTLRLERRDQLVGAGMYPNAFVSLAAAISPDPTQAPFLVDFPFELNNGSVEPAEGAYQKWLAHFPAEAIDQYRDGFTQLRGIRFDVGDSDPITHIPLGSRALSNALSELRIPHVFEEYRGNHTDRLGERLETKVLPFLSKELAFESETTPGRQRE